MGKDAPKFGPRGFILCFNLIKGCLKTWNVTTCPGEQAESIHMCMLDGSNWKRCTRSGHQLVLTWWCSAAPWECRACWVRDVVTWANGQCGYVHQGMERAPKDVAACDPQEHGFGLAAGVLAAGEMLHGKWVWRDCHWWDQHPGPREPLGGVWTLTYIKE